MFMITRLQDDIESGAYASADADGHAVIQFFVNKDDAVTYTTHLEAIGESLCVTDVGSDDIDKLCNVLGHPYTVVEPGEIVIPRLETLQYDEL